MNYDLDYFNGRDLIYPASPKKPLLVKDATAAQVREYADQLEVYEAEMVKYRGHREWYNTETNRRLQELRDRVRDDYDITQAQFDLLWNRAWEDGHSSGLHEVLSHFDDLYELATKFAALEG